MLKYNHFIRMRVSLLLLFACFYNSAFAADATSSIIEGKFIVVLKDNQLLTSAAESVSQVADRLIGAARQNQIVIDNQNGAALLKSSATDSNSYKHVYSHTIKGFSATLTQDAVTFLKNQPEIDYIEPDVLVSVDMIQNPTPSWGLDRIDQKNLPLDDSYEYTYDGTGVHAYVIDSGINASHEEFSGRIGDGYDFFDDDPVPNDCLGHGTHVSGTLGGTQYGVAKNVLIHPLKVFGCGRDGDASVVIAAIDWVAANHQAPAVVNMSLSSDAFSPMDAAINRAIADGITFVVSASNDYAEDACDYSPARVPNVITVAASTSDDSLANYSNIGTCVDIIAPGSSIKSAWHTSDTDTEFDNGTSMASPHVAGVVAQIHELYPSATPAEVKDLLLSASTKDVIANVGAGTPNLLLSSRFTDIQPAPEPPQGEFSKINIYYLIPSDRDLNQGYLDGIEKAALSIQSFYSQQLGGAVFATTNPIVQVVYSTENASWHADQMWGRAIDTVGAKFSDPNNIHVIYVDAMQSCTPGNAVGAASGIAVLPENYLRGQAGQTILPDCNDYVDVQDENRWIGGLGQYLGLALGAPQPQGCTDNTSECDSDSIMWLGYTNYPDTHLGSDAIATLKNSGFFSSTYLNPRGFPIEESFENGITWYDVGKYKWTVQSGSTPSAYTGPSQAAQGSSYLFFETSVGSAYDAFNKAVLESDVFASKDAKISFNYHMYGADTGTLSIEVSRDGLNWVPVWSIDGQQQDSSTAAWSYQVVRLDNYSGNIKLRISAMAAGGYRGDIAIDNLKIHNGIEILNASFDGDWFYTEWTPVSYAKDYSQFVIGDFTDGRRWLYRFGSGASNRGDFLYEYYHRNDICEKLGQGTYNLSAQVWPELLGNLGKSLNNVGEITCD